MKELGVKELGLYMFSVWYLRRVWRIVKHWWFTKVLRWYSFEITRQTFNGSVVYQCYGYLCQVNVTVEVKQ